MSFKPLYIVALFLLGIIHSAFAQVDHWEAILLPSDDCRYFKGDSEPPQDWKSNDFDDENWTSTNGGIGYGDSDDLTIIDRVVSVYIRYDFRIEDVDDVEEAILHADYDDGFVAYINGVEIARSLVNGNPPLHNTNATDLHEATLYQNGQPENFSFKKNVLDVFLQNGTNVLAIQVHNFDGLESSDLTSNFFLSLGMRNQTMTYRETPSWFTAPITEIQTHLPIVRINTNNRTIPDEPKIKASIGIINNEAGMNGSRDPFNEYEGEIEIEKRGQSSLGLFPKVNYGFELKDEEGNDLDTTFLNFPEEEDFVLHGPYSDKTLMRNVLAMKLANDLGGYHSRTEFVELYINDSYEGIYVLMEKIKRDKNRVDIAKLKEEDIEGDELTGGYVFKIDKGFPDWRSDFEVVNRPGTLIGYQFVSPTRDKVTPEQKAYIESYVDSFEIALRRGSFAGKPWQEYADINSFVDHFIIKELAKDVDAYRISSYYYKEKDSEGGKIHAGPVWDFNIAFGNAEYCEGFQTSGWMYSRNCDLGNPFWWNSLMSDDDFTNQLSCRWTDLRQGALSLDSITQFIDDQAEYLRPVVDRNFQKWPILTRYVWPNPQIHGNYQSEINNLKQFITGRLNWMDAAISASCTTTSTTDLSKLTFDLAIKPNPVYDDMQITFYNRKQSDVQLNVHDMMGRTIQSLHLPNLRVGEHLFSIGIPNLSKGMYILELASQYESQSALFNKEN